MLQRCNRARRGAVLVLVAIAMIPLIACVALAIDLGLMMAARTQVQAAADIAAMAGARALNGNTTGTNNNNYSQVLPTAQAAATANCVLAASIKSSQVSVNIGRYTYNTSTQRFEGQFPGPSTDNWSLCQATVTTPLASNLGFSSVMGFAPGNMSATATAVHRPRDVVIILDFSGSMRFQSTAGGPWNGSTNVANVSDSNVPSFGHFQGNTAQAYSTSFTAPYDAANLTATTSDGRPPIVQDFYQDSSGTPAWSAASASYATTPGGDNFLTTNKDTTSTYAQTLGQVLNIASPTTGTRDATFETSGYKAYGMAPSFFGYTQGPGYWGKTFFVWPPDPSNDASGNTQDWRRKFFYYFGTTTPCDDNALLWDSSGNWRTPGVGAYSINYAAILSWLKNTGPNPFPSQLRSGRIQYYTSIPNTIDTSVWPPADLNQRFWKDYIDYSLGICQTGSSSWTNIQNYAGFGPDFSWGTVKITAKSTLTGSPKPYMHYADNPLRPVSRLWFGPLTMVEFLDGFNAGYYGPYDGRYFWWPGTCHESPMYACKLGVQAALTNIQSSHPNDFVSLVFFSQPCASANQFPLRFNRVRVGLGRSYSNMIESLWYPPSTVGNANATVTPYDSQNLEVPRAFGGTCYAYPLMLAYNQFSGNTSLQNYNPAQPAGDAGGLGRKGAQKMIIFETDGAPNTTATGNFTNAGAYNSYYNVRYNSANPGSSEFPFNINGYSDLSSTVTTQIYSVCTQIAASDSAATPGYSSSTKPVKIHCIGFGPVFAPGYWQAASATACLNQMQTIGNVTDGMPSYKIVYGSQDTVVSNLQTAFQKIMQDGVQVTLIQ